MRPTTLHMATKVHRTRCDWRDLARYYLKSELPRIMAGIVQENIDEIIDRLDDMYFMRMPHAFSDTFRITLVADGTTDEGLDWYEVELPFSNKNPPGIRPPINDLMYS